MHCPIGRRGPSLDALVHRSGHRAMPLDAARRSISLDALSHRSTRPVARRAAARRSTALDALAHRSGVARCRSTQPGTRCARSTHYLIARCSPALPRSLDALPDRSMQSGARCARTSSWPTLDAPARCAAASLDAVRRSHARSMHYLIARCSPVLGALAHRAGQRSMRPLARCPTSSLDASTGWR
jgi:hypothetical protein